MRFLKGLLIGLVVLAVALVGVGFLLPSTTHMERSIVIQSPPATVFTVLNSFKRFSDWSPWKKYDPNAQISDSGPAAGVGAKQSWSSPETGDGSQEIIESKPHTSIRIKLQFADAGPDDQYIATYTLTPQGEGATALTWSFDGDYGNNLIGRYFGLVMDSMLGPDYEDGLANLKKLLEQMPTADFSKLEVSVLTVPAQTIAYVSGTTTTEVADISTAYAVAFSKVLAYLGSQKLTPNGAPVGISRKWDEEARVYEYDIGVPVEGASAGSGDVKLGQTYAGKAIQVIYKGAYRDMGPTYNALFAYAAVNDYKQNGNLWEEYVSDPAKTPEAELLTHIYMPVK